MMPATTSAATASPGANPAATATRPPSTASEPAMSPAKWNALERSAADLYRRAVRTETTIRDTSTTSATTITAKTYQRASSGVLAVHSRPTASVTMKTPPPIRIAGLAERAEVLGPAVAVVMGLGEAGSRRHDARFDGTVGGDHDGTGSAVRRPGLGRACCSLPRCRTWSPALPTYA